MKRTSFKIFIVGAFCSSLLALSCNNYLEIRSDDSQKELKELPDLQAAMDVMPIMTNLSGGGGGRLIASSDEYFVEDDLFNSLLEIERAIYTWTPADYEWPNEWSIHYRAVAQANIVLDVLSKIQRSGTNAALWDEVKGAALFFRSFHFLNLIWVYGKAYDQSTSMEDLGIPLRTTSNINVFVDRSNVKDTYGKILEDALEAAALLPEESAHVIRPSKPAAYALLARTYLSMREYDKAGEYADLCLSIRYQLIDYNTDLPDLHTNIPFSQYNKEVVFHSQVGAGTMIWGTNPKIDSLLYTAYEDDDLRKIALFTTVGDYVSFKGNYTGTSTDYFLGLATNEMYLIRAECNARKGNQMEAVHALSYLLHHRYKANTELSLEQLSSQQLLDRILWERRKELLMNGLRWQDIKRLNKEGANIVLKRVVNGEIFTLLPNENRYALPLPADIVVGTGMKQNPQ